MPLERRRFFFSGHVQGVGFRATVRSLSRGFEVAGHVRNLADGRVEVLAEGDSGELDRFLAAIRAEMGYFIQGVIADPEPAGDPPLEGFTIRH